MFFIKQQLGNWVQFVGIYSSSKRCQQHFLQIFGGTYFDSAHGIIAKYEQYYKRYVQLLASSKSFLIDRKRDDISELGTYGLSRP